MFGNDLGMNVIFLDIDGVLNFSKSMWRLNYETNKSYKLEPGEMGGMYGIDQDKVAILLDLIEQTQAKLVLSSTWRLSKDWLKTMDANGIPARLFIGRTPSHPLIGGAETMERGHEIQAWLETNKDLALPCNSPTSCPPPTRAMCMGHKVGRYAILDDDSDMLPGQPLFQTSWEEGLTQDIADRVRDYFCIQLS